MKSDAQLREEIIRDLPETTDLVERVARALCQSHGQNPDGVLGGITGEHPMWEAHKKHARAAIEAYESALQARVEKLEAENAELRKERDALLQKPIDLAKMDSIDDEATDRMIAYYWWQQATDARAALAEDYCGIVEVNEEDFKAEGEKG